MNGYFDHKPLLIAKVWLLILTCCTEERLRCPNKSTTVPITINVYNQHNMCMHDIYLFLSDHGELPARANFMSQSSSVHRPRARVTNLCTSIGVKLKVSI